MRNTCIACCLLLTATAGFGLQADELVLPEVTSTASLGLPSKGDSQNAVLRAFGEPVTRHAPVGGGSAAQPPITRWDYSGFAVFFENSHVVDAVVPNAPAPLFNTSELGSN